MEKNVLLKVLDRITQIKKEIAEESQKIIEKEREINDQLRINDEEKKESARLMDIKRYEVAEERERKLKTEKAMYHAKYEQSKNWERVTESESDEVINSLLEYEKQVNDAFKQEFFKLMKETIKLNRAYQQEIRTVENTFIDWTSNIHPNFRHQLHLYEMDPGLASAKVDYPVPVHRTNFIGCLESVRFDEFIKLINVGKNDDLKEL